MGGKIDKQMMNDFKTYSQRSSDQGKQISEQEAMTLIRRAKTLNGTYTSSCFGSSENKGTNDLKSLVKQHGDRFSPESKAAINAFVTTGNLPRYQTAPVGMDIPVVNPPYNAGVGGSSMPSNGAAVPVFANGGMPPIIGSGGAAVRNPGIPSGSPSGVNFNGGAINAGAGHAASGAMDTTRRDAPRAGRPRADSGPGSNGSISARPDPRNPAHGPAAGGAVLNPTGPRPTPATPVAPTTPTTPTTPATPAAPSMPSTPPANIGGPTGVSTPHGTRTLDFKSQNSTWNCHWFPMQETRPGGDAMNNLYAKGGALYKLDLLTGKSSQQYEYAHHRKGIGEGRQYSWWGHCNDAAQSACILREPKRAVTMTARDGSKVTFDTNDIQGLLVKASSSLMSKVDFKGQRFNTANRDDPNEPYPDMFIEVMTSWAKDGLPFVLDIDREGQVWNFPYDQVQIDESTRAPQGFDPSSLASNGAVTYYHIHMAGTGYPDKVRNYECFVQRDGSGKVLKSGWIKTPNTNNNPDFMWRPHPAANLYDRATWHLHDKPSNPEIDMQTIYDIYMQSIA